MNGTDGDDYMALHEHPHRRVMDHKLDAIANSSLLRVIFSSLLMIALPLAGWAMSTMLDRLNKIEANQNAVQVGGAIVQVRMMDLEKQREAADAMRVRMNERLMKAEFALEQVQEQLRNKK